MDLITDDENERRESRRWKNHKPVLLMNLLFWALDRCSFFSFFLLAEAVVVTSHLEVSNCAKGRKTAARCR